MNYVIWMVDFSSKKNKNGRKSENKNARKNRTKTNELIIDPQNLYSEPLEQFDEEFSEDLKVRRF